MDVVIGIDTGTTATKAIAAGPAGEVRAMTSVHYPLSVPGPGQAELDPDKLRDAAIEALVTVAKESAAQGDRVIAIGLSAFLHGLAPMDANGAPLGPLITWADNRASGQADEINAAGRAKGLQARTGTPVHPMSPLAKLTWWNANDPAKVRDTPRWGGVKEVVLAGLAAEGFLLDLSLASGTGMYDIHERHWDPEALSLTGVRENQLAEVVPTTHRLRLRPEVASAAGLPPEIPLIIGAADGPLANLGVGATPAGVAAVSLGTSGALRTIVNGPTADNAGRLFCYALTEEHWVVGGAINNAGSVVRWAGETFAGSFDRPAAEGEDADVRDAALLVEAAEIAAGSEGLLCLPYLLGERAPWWRGGMRGAYLGLRREHGRAHLVRAAVEGVCQQLALVRDTFADEGIAMTEVRATGGAVASELWVGILASALDLPVAVAETPEGTALGACLLARHALGELPDLDQAAAMIGINDHTRPDESDAALYRRLRPLVERSALAVTDVLTELDKIAPEPLPGTEKAVPNPT
ncbi:gluconokinase [Actinoplanes friuliensis]|uniref:Putative FGGY-family carbohydrate kinase n=1 Tax=Actinoplanes friuliensis DSM 7358 TaxID=1246995 RepID=U5W3Q3_9ACTN|nr:gluconokinase [Actinoplanes friuliensis]AGZ43647.1 putative FGGY-family carbohydrate kinase [Actinoplanes friuliensis DSM 7358]